MDNFSHCTVILYLNHKGSTLNEVKEDMMFTAGEDSPSYKSMVKRWIAKLQHGWETL